VGCVVIAVAFAGWSSAARADDGAAEPPAAADQAQVGIGEVYRRDCAVCHGADAEGTDRGPTLRDDGLALVDYMLRTGRMPIDDPDDEIERREPAYDPSTIDALVAYVGRLQGGAVADGPPIPSVDPAAGDVAVGGEVWRLNCAPCHQWSGGGGALLDRSAPGVRSATPLEMAEAVRSGPLAMPAFGQAAVDDDQLNGLAAFFQDELDMPDDPGGWSLGHVGPVAEGGIALVGAGLLMVISRLLGTGRKREPPA
jgi:ubiquinol-cytochrome c reductase cytochrome c subunit